MLLFPHVILNLTNILQGTLNSQNESQKQATLSLNNTLNLSIIGPVESAHCFPLEQRMEMGQSLCRF